LSDLFPWRIAGRYLESCNCDAICPCRMVGGIRGGRSTHGICYGALSWLVDSGRAGAVDLTGLAASLVLRYDDDEPGSPWTFVLHVDARGDERQRDALAKILLGELGGDQVLGLPWVRKPSNLLEVRASAIEIRHGADGYELRVGEAVALRATRPVPTDQEVACVIPGFDHPGTELYADSFAVDDEPFRWELQGNCGFASDFDYAGR
jgi:Protein of unknown function (DUF1326)